MGKERSSNDGTTPICRCRVMYLGSSVPHATKDGLQGIQEPLRDLYPESGLVDYGSAGIDSWISVWSNGILIENVDDSGREVKRFFPIESLHYCAAVRYVVIPSISGHNNTNGIIPNTVTSPTLNSSQQPATTSSSSGNSTGITSPNNINNHVNSSTLNNGDGDKNYDKVAKFLPLDSPFLRGADNGHPPLFACILRRTTGIKVLECHAFICKREPAANALVRCCFHAYADSMYAKQIEENPYSHIGSGVGGAGGGSHLTSKKSRSVSALDTVDKSDNNWNDSQPTHLSRDLLEDLPPPPPPHHGLGTNGHINHHPAPSEIGAGSTVSQSPDEDNYKITWPPGGPPPLSSGHYIREGPINTMRPGLVKPRPMIIHMGPPPPGGGGGQPIHPAMLAGNHPPPPPFGIPIALSDHPHADKILKHSLKKKKKKSKSKMILNGSSLLIGPGPGPFPVPVNFVQVPQMSPQGSGHHHLMHHPPPPPSHQQHHPHNTIYGPLPGPPTGAPPPPPGSTAYSVRTRLRRGHSSGGPAPGEYPLMFAGPGEEPIYIPPMRPLTPLSNYHGHHHSMHHQQHHSHHPHHQQSESHYVSYPVTYGTTPRRDKYRSKDRINGNSRSVLGSSSGPNGGGNGGGTTGEETERDSSPSAVGLYKRKGHLNERAFSYSIRQEHRSRSNSVANLTIDDSPGRPIANGSGGSGSSGGERGDDEHLHSYHHHPHHHSNRHSHHHDSRHGPSSAFGERERERSSAHSSGNFDRHGTTNGGHYNGSRDSFIDYREVGRANEMSSLSASMANLNFNGHASMESKNVPKTASIKRSSKQRNSLGSKGMPIAPPLPPPSSHAMNGKSMDAKSTRKL